MKKIFFIVFTFLIGQANAQSTNTCKDSAAADPYFNCGADAYDPICGCDFFTYRSVCAAERRGGLIFGSWTIGACGVFDFEFTPNIIAYSSASIKIWVQPILFPINASVFIHDIFGRKKFEETFRLPLDYIDSNYKLREVNLNNFEKGIYVVTVSVAGSEQAKKIMKISID